MSVELYVYLRDEQLPSWQEWQSALDAAGSRLQLDDFPPLQHTGFVPAKLDGQDCGFEYRYGPAESEEDEEVLAALGDRDYLAQFVWHGNERDARAGTLAAAILAKIADGVFLDPQSGEFAQGGDVFAMLQRQEQDERDRRMRLAEKKWGDSTKRRCPECGAPCHEYRSQCSVCGLVMGRA